MLQSNAAAITTAPMTKVAKEVPVSKYVRECAVGPRLIASLEDTCRPANVMLGHVATHGLAAEGKSVPMTMTVTLGLPVDLANAKTHALIPVHLEPYAPSYGINQAVSVLVEP